MRAELVKVRIQNFQHKKVYVIIPPLHGMVPMQIYQKEIGRDLNLIERNFMGRLSKENWSYIKTVVDIVREPILILDKQLRVMAANESFYKTFQVEEKATEGTLVYELGNGQWNIPALRKLLEDILPKNTFMAGFEVSHDFPVIGRKDMLLNARQIHFDGATASEFFPPIIFLAMEDISPMMAIAETLASHVKELAASNANRATTLEMHIGKLQQEIDDLKKGA